MKTIDRVGKILPIFTLFVIVLSSFKLAIFYKVFNVTIVNYLSVTEYIPLFINDLHTLAIMVLPGFFGAFVGFYIYKQRKEEIEKKYPVKEFSRSRQIKYVLITIVIIIVIGLVTYFRYQTISTRLEFIQPVILFLFFWFLAIPTKEEKGFFYFTLWFIILLSSVLTISAYKDAYEILENKKAHSYQIAIGDKLINCVFPYQYIGRTEKYLFIYNCETENTIVKNLSDIDEIRIIKRTSNE